MGSKPRSTEDYVSRLVLEKQRAIYWLCSLLERDSSSTRAGARRALAELGYDDRRIHSMLLLGEPVARAGEPVGPGSCDGSQRQPAAGRWSALPRGTCVLPNGTLLEHGPGSG
jgi:hypothetical protein